MAEIMDDLGEDTVDAIVERWKEMHGCLLQEERMRAYARSAIEVIKSGMASKIPPINQKRDRGFWSRIMSRDVNTY